MRPDRTVALRWWALRVALPLCALAAIAILLGRSEWDARSLEPFFDRAAGTFPLRRAWFFDDVLHVGGKYLVVAAACIALLWCVLHWRSTSRRQWRARILYLVACVATTSVLAGLWKQLAGQTTPWDTTRFGGSEPWPTVLVGSPGAHAASGFAWVALYYVGASLGARRRWTWLAPGLLLGALFAVSQHVRGAHVPSHEPWSLFIAWSVASGLAWIFRARGWLEWREVEAGPRDEHELSAALRAEPWLLGAAGTFFGAFIFQADLLLEEYSARLAELHEWFEVAELTLMGPGLGVATFLVVERMLTARERALEREIAERQRRFQILGQLAASVAHEVRNPLHSLRLIVDEQRHDVPALAAHPLRGELEGCLQRIDNAVDLVYSLARPGAEAGTSADLAAIVREGVTMLEHASPNGPALALAQFPKRADVAGAPARVRIVVENVLRNAWRASRAGDRVDVELAREADDWVLDIRNPGSLAPPAEGVREGAGLGIGLSIARRIVDDAGGRIELSERDGSVHCVIHWPASRESQA